MRILNESGDPVTSNEEGFVAIKLPMPPGCVSTLWNDFEGYANSYLSMFEGYYTTGDGGFIDQDGYVFIMGRVDDVINVSGHRLSTGEMEEVVASHAAVVECAVVGVEDELRGQLPVGLIVLNPDNQMSEEAIEQELVQLVREKIGAVACFKTVHVVNRLPKTRSGKILRKTIRQIANHKDVQVPSTIDDITVLDEIKSILD